MKYTLHLLTHEIYLTFIDPNIHHIYDTYNQKIISINNYKIIDPLVISSIFGSTIWITII